MEDAELDVFRQGVNCAAVLERMASGWKLDARESTRHALKYRRGSGEIIIANHDGRRWWDATSSAKGDVFNLVRHLDPSLNFGQVRQVLRGFMGIVPTYPVPLHERAPAKAERTPAERWAQRPRLRRGDGAWDYLAGPQAIPDAVLRKAADRALAQGWKARAAANIAAIRLAREIEEEARPASADEQERLARFTGFGASDLANSFFRRAGEAFRPGWEDLGNELEQLVSAEEMSALARSVQLYVTWNIHRIGVDGQGGKYEHNCGVAEPLADVGHSGTSARLAEHARRSRAGTAHNRRLRARCFDVFGVQRGIRR